MSERLFAFGAFVLDAERKLLLKDGTPIPVGHRGLALLEALLTAGGRVVGKSELMDLAWPAQAVEESNLSVQIAALRKNIGTRPDGEEWIATVPRVGYQFVPMVPEPKNAPASEVRALLELVDSRVTIAVLPFTNLSDNREQEFFADGMTDDIISALARIKDLFVVSRSSSFVYKGRAIHAKDAARELGVRYTLEGSVRVAGDRVRVNAQLIDGISGGHIWTERYHGNINDIFAVQDEITRSIAIAMQVKLTQGQSAQLWDGQTKSLRAWEKMVQARNVFSQYTTIDTGIARRLLEEVLLIDPKYAGAIALLGITYYWDARFSLSVDKARALNLVEAQAEKIHKLNSKMGAVSMLRGMVAFLRDQTDEAVLLCKTAVDLAPSDFRAMTYLGQTYMYAGWPDKALITLKTAVRLKPHRESWLTYYLTLARLWMGNFQAALESATLYLQQEPNEPYGYMYLAVVYGAQGLDDKAATTVSALREKFPDFGIKNVILSERYKEREKLDQILNVLRTAGLPE